MTMLLDLLFSDEPAAPAEFALVRVSRRAMATTFEVAIPAGSHPDPVAAGTDALDLIDDLEDQLTVYRDHSEVSRLNETAAGGFVAVEEQLFELLSRCAIWTKETGGAFDLATGALTKAWGFSRREPAVPAPRVLSDVMNRTGFRHVLLDADRRAVKFRVPGLELNFGAVGKGYALDRAAELLRRRWGVRSALLQGGGSSVYAIGPPPGDPRGWPIRLKHPWVAGRALGTVFVRDGGLGTSAATFQFFEYNGRKLGHLLDPRTGWPATGTASASVTAPTAAEADAMSTAAFILGAPGAERMTRLRPVLGAVVLGEEDPPPSPLPAGRGRKATDQPESPEACGGSASPSLQGGGRGVGRSDAHPVRARRAQDAPPSGGGLLPLAFNLAPDVYSPSAHADDSP